MHIYDSSTKPTWYEFTPEEKWVMQYALWSTFCDFTAEVQVDIGLLQTINRNDVYNFWQAFLEGEDYTLTPSKTDSKKGEH